MANPSIPEGKKRYYVTLTEENMDWLRHLVCDLGKQRQNAVSVMIDNMIGEMREALDPIVKKYEETGSTPSWADFHIMLGKQLQKIGDDQPELNIR